MDYVALLKTLEAFTISDFVRSSTWAYPILETIHMFGLGLVFGGMFVFDLRLFGLHPDISLSRLADHIFPWVWFGFLLNLLSGVLLFMSDAVTFGLNLAFQLKVILLAVTGLCVMAFQRVVAPNMSDWDRGVAPPRAAKLIAILSIILWLLVITAGRMIAYVPEPEIVEEDGFIEQPTVP